jgi:3-hydroxybutyryl-CoA dehydrogenase
MSIQSVAVIGSGFMGGGIAQVSAQAGYAVTLMDLDTSRTQHALQVIRWSVEKLSSKGFLKDAPDVVMGRIATTTDLNAARDVDLVVEAVFEKIDVKQEVLRKLDGICSSKTILGSNTSTIPITTLAEATKRPDRVIGIHFFGPVPLMRLVEIIPNPQTSKAVVDTVLAYGKAVGKSPVLVKKDIPGFLMNRVFGAMACEAMRLVESGAGSVEDIDQGMCDGFNMRMGPIGISDLAGLDISLNAFAVMHQLDPKSFTEPPAILVRLVKEGKLGAKTGEGFYRWSEDGKRLGPAI